MINTSEIKLNKPIYYVPQYGGVTKVQICKINGDIAIIKPISNKKQYSAYPIALEYVCESPAIAKKCSKKWESWKRKENKKK